MLPFKLPVLPGRENLQSGVDLLLGSWRLRERVGVHTVAPEPGTLRVVVCGNWALEVHRLLAALRRSGGGHLLILDTQGRDTATAARHGLFNRTILEQALQHPDLRQRCPLTDRASAAPPHETDPDEDQSAMPPVSEPADPADPPSEGGDEATQLDTVALAGDSADTLLIVPASILVIVDGATLGHLTGWRVERAPDRIAPRAAYLLDPTLPIDDPPPTLRERLAWAISAAAFLTVLALVPLLIIARPLLLPGLAMIWGEYVLVALLSPSLSRLPVALRGAVVGIVSVLLVLALWAFLGKPWADRIALNSSLALVAAGTWAGYLPGEAGGADRRTLSIMAGVAGTCALIASVVDRLSA